MPPWPGLTVEPATPKSTSSTLTHCTARRSPAATRWHLTAWTATAITISFQSRIRTRLSPLCASPSFAAAATAKARRCNEPEHRPTQYSGKLLGEHPRRGGAQEGPDRRRDLRLLPYPAHILPHTDPTLRLTGATSRPPAPSATPRSRMSIARRSAANSGRKRPTPSLPASIAISPTRYATCFTRRVWPMPIACAVMLTRA